jgi:predicted Zn-dependent protease
MPEPYEFLEKAVGAMRRLFPALVAFSLLCSVIPAPARAMSTAAEIQLGQSEDQDIVAGSVIETDPLMNAYVQGIAENLWNQVARKDVPYSIKVIKDDSINSFATMGGFVYIDEGLIDFVQSDDEFASVIGHETGHIERRHVITSQSKAQILDILFGLASMFSPLLYNFGGLAEAGIMAKISREDELQADRYGLQLMSRAGYDPESMVTMMAHLGVLQDEHSDLLTKYLEDHPDPKNRVSHLMGYPELDPKNVTTTQQLVQASSDEERARYSFSSYRLHQVLAKEPQDPEALLELGQSELALGQTSKSEQTLAEAAQLGAAQTRATANQRIAALRQMQVERVNLTHPNLPKLQAAVQAAKTSQLAAATQIQARASEGKDQLKSVNNRMNSLQYEIPDFSRINIKRGSKVEAIVKNLNLMSRSINSALQDAGDAIGGVGSLEVNKESGLLKEGSTIYDEMLAPFSETPIPSDSLAILPDYPKMIDQLTTADVEMLRSVDAARASLTLLDQSLGDLDEFLKQLDEVRMGYNGDIGQSSYADIEPLMKKTVAEFDAAAGEASQSTQLYNMARTRQLSSRIALLGLGSSPQRYSSLQYALQQRFGSDGLDYRTMLRDGLTPGDVTVATIVAADIKSTPEAIVAEARSSKESVEDVANAHGMHAWPLEIFTGLVYLDFTDDPFKELRKADGTESVELSQLGL